jgi:phosphoserine phosphatase
MKPKLTDFKLIAMDMDSTLITIECIDEIADFCGLKAQVAAITEAAMNGEIVWRESFLRRVALLKGLPVGVLQEVYDHRLKLSPGAEVMLAAMRGAGLKTLLVSGGFTFFTDKLQARLGLDYTHSNTLVVADGKLTGEVTGELVDAHAKARKLAAVCAHLGVPTSQAIAVGDGANDLEMMAIAGLSVAYHAKPVVREKATHAINEGGLDQMLGFFL